MPVGVHFKDDRLPYLIYNTAAGFILHGYVKVVSSLSCYRHIVLGGGVCQKQIKRQVEEPLRDAPVSQRYLRLNRSQTSDITIGNRYSRCNKRTFSLDENSIGGKDIVKVKTSFSGESC